MAGVTSMKRTAWTAMKTPVTTQLLRPRNGPVMSSFRATFSTAPRSEASVATSARTFAPGSSQTTANPTSFQTSSSTPNTSNASNASNAPNAPAETIPGTDIRVFRSVDGLRAWRRQQLLEGRRVGLLPTMGALHQGHLTLARTAAQENDVVVVSVYVNPTQFGVNEDLASYPRTWTSDCAALAGLQEELRADCGQSIAPTFAVFAPTTTEMYPSGPPGQDLDSDGSFVTITPVGTVLEGASRPTFFRGVATVVMKLFHMVQPDRAYFGQKDIQQTVVVRRMVRDFAVPVDVRICPTVRESDGLALSSRNMYLGVRRRAVAPVLRHALEAAAVASHENPEATPESILGAAYRVFYETLTAQKKLPPSQRCLFALDYISLADPETMLELQGPVDPAKGAILSGALRMLPVEEAQENEDLGHSEGPMVRLIDNIVLEPRETKEGK